MTPRSKLPGLLLLTLFAACTDGLAQREAAMSRFIGLPETELVRALGVPARSIEADGRRFLAYVERTQFFRPAPIIGGWRPGLPPIYQQDELVERVCETTFEVTAGIVSEVRLRGNGCG